MKKVEQANLLSGASKYENVQTQAYKLIQICNKNEKVMN